jgi:hypothetical protein
MPQKWPSNIGNSVSPTTRSFKLQILKLTIVILLIQCEMLVNFVVQMELSCHTTLNGARITLLLVGVMLRWEASQPGGHYDPGTPHRVQVRSDPWGEQAQPEVMRFEAARARAWRVRDRLGRTRLLAAHRR